MKVLRLVEEVNISSGANVRPIELPTDRWIESIIISVRGTVDTLNATGVGIGAPWSVVRNLVVRLSGIPFINIADAALLAYAVRMDRQSPDDIDAYDDTDDAAQTFGFDLEIPISSLAARVHGQRAAAQRTLMPAFSDAQVRNPTIAWTWGTASDLAVGGTVDAEIAGTCRVLVRERETGYISPMHAPNQFIPLIESREDTWTAAETRRRIRLPRAGSLRRIILELSDNGTLNDDDIGDLSLEVNGVQRWGPVDFSELRRETLAQYDLVSSELEAGIAAIDYNVHGDLTGLFPAGNARTFDLLFDAAATTAGRLRILTESYTLYGSR